MDQRKEILAQWVASQLQTLHQQPVSVNLQMVSGDASFRRYFRCQLPPAQGGDSVICVDAPVATENNPAFVKVAAGLAATGIRVPAVLGAEFEQGLLLLSDLGDQLLLPQLTEQTVDQYYRQAMAVLLNLMAAKFDDAPLPRYDQDLLQRELNLFRDWFCQQYLGLSLSAEEADLMGRYFDQLCQQALAQPQVTVHRDFHSRNIMILDSGELGVIDFQDAVRGPITYDLVSLLRDAYVAWPLEQVKSWVADFCGQLNAQWGLGLSEGEYWRWFNQVAAQRHLKVLGIFARLSLRDGKSGYLSDMPLTYSYLQRELTVLAADGDRLAEAFGHWLTSRVLPSLLRVQPAAATRLRNDV